MSAPCPVNHLECRKEEEKMHRSSPNVLLTFKISDWQEVVFTSPFSIFLAKNR
jgi:hypothetical protein